ncbi:hypothetical protein BGW41_006839 [Actinomortierella wolfii]|nr:hypothetical protein BGW41_006839 [Actinomortierella wolfii]
MGSDIIDFSSPDSSTDLSLSSSSSSEVKTLRNLKAEFTSGTTTQTVGVKSRTVANTKTDVSENSNSDNNTNEGGGEGEGRPMTQERAAVMTRRHNNAFFQFSMQHRKRLTRELRLPSHRITQILGNMWKQLPESQKLEFEKMAYQEQQKIMTEQNKYFKKHGLGIKNVSVNPPSNAPTEAKKSQTRTEKETIQADATAKAVSTTASQQASPTSTGSKESLFRSLTSHPQRPEDKGAYHSVHRPNNKWDRQTQSGKIVFTEPLTLPRSKEKHKTGLGSGGGNRSTSERPVSAASEDATVVFMPAYTTQNRPTMGPPPPLAGPSGRVEGAAATAASAGRKRSPRIIPASGESSTHARLNLAMPSAEGEGHDSADVSEQRYLRDKNVYDRHQHGNELEGEDMYGGSYAPSTPYYSGPCYIPPSPYPLGPSLLNDSGDEDVEEEDYEYHDYAQHDGHEGEESNRGEFVASIA